MARREGALISAGTDAVVSIVVTILFWAACFAVGATKNVMEQVWINPARLILKAKFLCRFSSMATRRFPVRALLPRCST